MYKYLLHKNDYYNFILTFETHSFALYSIISDVRFIATDTGIIVCTFGDFDDIKLFVLSVAVSCLVQIEQNT